jgi:hypothetical protein
MIRHSALLLVLALSAQSAPAFAQDKPFFPLPLPFPNFDGTPDEQKACRPDVVRLCPETVSGTSQPDTNRVLACLQANRSKLKASCRQVLESHGV